MIVYIMLAEHIDAMHFTINKCQVPTPNLQIEAMVEEFDVGLSLPPLSTELEEAQGGDGGGSKRIWRRLVLEPRNPSQPHHQKIIYKPECVLFSSQLAKSVLVSHKHTDALAF